MRINNSSSRTKHPSSRAQSRDLPLVSILIPAYNSKRFIGASLDSALAQTYKNIEIIVHDDASTDNTLKILKSYSDKRLRIIHTKNNHGMIAGWNYIAKYAKGEYIKFLASDDLLFPTCVSELVKAALQHPSASIITCSRQFIDENKKVINRIGYANRNIVVDGIVVARDILTSIRENKIGEPSAVLYPTKLIKLAGLYDPQFTQFADFEYWIRLLGHGDLVYINKTLCSFRIHPGSSTTRAIRDGAFINETFALIHKYYIDPFFVNLYSLPESDRKFVTRQKTLDILKNIKDLLFSGRIRQSTVYLYRLLSSFII